MRAAKCIAASCNEMSSACVHAFVWARASRREFVCVNAHSPAPASASASPSSVHKHVSPLVANSCV
eukprot:1162584-Pleurochrysis_carterae.AAC.1